MSHQPLSRNVGLLARMPPMSGVAHLSTGTCYPVTGGRPSVRVPSAVSPFVTGVLLVPGVAQVAATGAGRVRFSHRMAHVQGNLLPGAVVAAFVDPTDKLGHRGLICVLGDGGGLGHGARLHGPDSWPTQQGLRDHRLGGGPMQTPDLKDCGLERHSATLPFITLAGSRGPAREPVTRWAQTMVPPPTTGAGSTPPGARHISHARTVGRGSGQGTIKIQPTSKCPLQRLNRAPPSAAARRGPESAGVRSFPSSLPTSRLRSIGLRGFGDGWQRILRWAARVRLIEELGRCMHAPQPANGAHEGAAGLPSPPRVVRPAGQQDGCRELPHGEGQERSPLGQAGRPLHQDRHQQPPEGDRRYHGKCQ